MKYQRKIETIVEALQFKGTDNYYDALEFMGREKADKSDPEKTVMVKTPSGGREAKATDWIIKDEYGHYWLLGDGSFQHQYEVNE